MLSRGSAQVSRGLGGCRGRGSKAIKRFDGKDQDLELYPDASDRVTGPGVGEDTSYRVLDDLKSMDGGVGDADRQDFCIVKPGYYEGVYGGFGIFTSMFDRNIAFWIGLYNSNHSETGWKWLNGDKFNYTHWKEKEPNGYRGAMICVAVTNGMWFDDYCNQTYWFMSKSLTSAWKDRRSRFDNNF
uniref:C-type lectin domain-containing protein n=1 Tax=Callorhinchus milii TaxID=7868 RepID=A0A4W3ILR2_CALMI